MLPVIGLPLSEIVLPMPLDPALLMHLDISARDVAYNQQQVMHYALAAGLGAEGDPADLPFVTEAALTPLPSLATMLAFDDSWLPAAGIDLRQVVHGGLDLRFHAKLVAEGSAQVTCRIIGLADKGPGRGGVVLQQSDILQRGGIACTVLSSMFVRGAGGFGGDTGQAAESPAIPAGPPDAAVRVATARNQALWFRLLGDRNPLHADPLVAREAGFDRPILHGACTFAIACATLLRQDAGMDPSRLSRFAARFAGPLYPGETLRFDLWRAPGRVAFRAYAQERDAIVLDNGLAELRPAA